METRIVPKGTENNHLGFIESKGINIPANPMVIISMHGNGREDGRNNPGDTGEESDLRAYLNSSGHLPYMLDNDTLGSEIMTIVENFVVIFPQIQNGWIERVNMERLLNYANETYNASKVVLMGLSAGGSNVWKAIQEYPSLFDIAIPICGAASYENMERNGDNIVFPEGMKVWAFDAKNDYPYTVHTYKNIGKLANNDWNSYFNSFPYSLKNVDPAPPRHVSMSFIDNTGWVEDALNISKITCTMYKDGGHGIWGRTYKTLSLWEWLKAEADSVVVNPPPPDPDPTPEDVLKEEIKVLKVRIVEKDNLISQAINLLNTAKDA